MERTASAPLPRRRLFALLAASSPLLVAQRRRAVGAGRRLDSGTLIALADAVLPTELGAQGVAAAASAFERWLAGYRGGAEVLHDYGASEIRYLPPSPALRFEADLTRLEKAARTADNTAFSQLSRDARRSIVEATLAPVATDRLPEIADAPHVAIALLAHWANSTSGYDAGYRAKIGRFGCRPLADSPKKPARLGGAG